MVSCATSSNNAPPIHRKMLLLVENFDRFDENGDGTLSRMELEKAVETMGPDRLTKEQYNRAMLVYDTNGDNKVSRAEAETAAANGPVLFEN
jgi:Ca2+-binding EF-hand superfamily protein